MIQTKKLIPAVYSQSYDFSIFTAVLDLVYTARELDILRMRNSHLPTKCFEEDISRLSSLFGLGDLAPRDLLAEYRLLVKQKGSADVISAIAQFASGITATSNGAKLRIITDTLYGNEEKISVIKETEIITATEEEPAKTVETIQTTRVAKADEYAAVTDSLARMLNEQKAAEETNDDGTITKYLSDDNFIQAIKASSNDTPISILQSQIVTRTVQDGELTISRPHDGKVTLPEKPIKGIVSTIEVYVDFAELKSDLLELLIRRLAPVGTHIIVKHKNEHIPLNWKF